MAEIRVFLVTHRRPALLRRALASLRAQTFTDWVCELHNDAPDDDDPRRLVEETGDPRILYRHHERNWGPVAVFNHAYAGGPEPCLSILEDDNWWEPGFLAAALDALRARPEANVAWANMRLWQETPKHEWRDTGRTIWPAPAAEAEPRIFRWPVALQAYDALHSHGAMVCRAAASRVALVPPETPLDVIEHVRERLLPGAWLLLPRPLANFAITLRTARAADHSRWARAQLLIASSYLLAVRPDRDGRAAFCAALRGQTPPATSLIFQLAFSNLRHFGLLRHTRPGDWWRFFRGLVRRPHVFLKAMRYRSRSGSLWPRLLAAAKARSEENRLAAPPQALYRKTD